MKKYGRRLCTERHENEQYFFDHKTVKHLAAFLVRYETSCVICAPMLGTELAGMGVGVRILDVDERFSTVRGFRRWDINRPDRLSERYGIIVCDPPFFNVSLSRLFTAIRILAHNDFSQPLLVSYLRRRTNAILGTFAPFSLEKTGFFPSYVTVQAVERNDIEFFGNLGFEAHEQLRNGAGQDCEHSKTTRR